MPSLLHSHNSVIILISLWRPLEWVKCRVLLSSNEYDCVWRIQILRLLLFWTGLVSADALSWGIRWERFGSVHLYCKILFLKKAHRSHYCCIVYFKANSLIYNSFLTENIVVSCFRVVFLFFFVTLFFSNNVDSSIALLFLSTFLLSIGSPLYQI